MPSRPPTAAIAALLASVSALAGCGARDSSTTTTLQPLVTAGAVGGVETTVDVTTTVFVSDPGSPLLVALPDLGCALADPVPAGEITFVVGDRLFGVGPDGSGARCLATLPPNVRGTVSWSPDSRRAVVGAAALLEGTGTRATGFNADNVRVQWEYPAGAGLIAPTETSNTLVRRNPGEPQSRSEVTFLAQTQLAVSHPAGQGLIASGTDRTGAVGVFFADPVGKGARTLATAGANARIPELAVDASGDALYFVAESNGAWSVQRLDLRELGLADISDDPAPAGRLMVGPAPGSAAWRVGLCNSITQLRVRDARSGETRTIDATLPLAGLSLSPVGWLDGARVVVAARPLGCDGPADIWIWNLLDGSATLITKNVEFPAVRLPFAGSLPFEISPQAQPARL